MSQLTELKKVLELYGPDVSKNVKIFSKEEALLPFLLRIDQTLPKTYIPRMPKSAATTENSTVPRVVTAETLMGCLCGHSFVFDLVTNRWPNDDFKNNVYKILHFDFDYALRINKGLVFDAEETGECWLVAYDKATIQYNPTLHGEFFINRISIHARGSEKLNPTFAEICIRIIDSRGVMLTPNIHLGKGCHYVKLDITRYGLGTKVMKEMKTKRMTQNADAELSVTSIKEDVYQSFYRLAVGARK